MDKQEQPQQSPEVGQRDPFSAAAGNMQRAWSQSQQRFASTMAAISAEMAKFASRRLEAQAKAWETCARCEDLPSLTKSQGQFIRDMMSDYSSEASELMRRTQEIVMNGWIESSK